jgi:hypothetical protein
MIGTPPNTTVSTDADLFREEAERARRFAAAMSDKSVIERLNQIAACTTLWPLDKTLARPIAINPPAYLLLICLSNRALSNVVPGMG